MPRCSRCVGLSLAHLVDLAHEELPIGWFPRRAFYRHHGSFADLELSANDGCDFCQLVLACFRGAPDGSTAWSWPREWTSPKTIDGGEEVPDSMYQEAMELDESDVKISIDASHVKLDASIDDVHMFDQLLVQVGPNNFDDDYQNEPPGIPTLTLKLVVDRGSPLRVGRFRIGRTEPEPDLGSRVNHDIVRQWLDECRALHPECLIPGARKLPTRVIDVGAGDGARIIEARGMRAEYAALSHCWGGKIAAQLTSETLPLFRERLPVASLPPNFRDAITATRELGIPYLWIDSLCILQDSRRDWEAESKTMADVYRGATVTLTALCARGSGDGFLKVCPKPAPDPPGVVLAVPNSEDGTVVDVRVERQTYQEENLRELQIHSPLASRGWVFQEEILSPRQVYYGRQQIYWKCPRGYLALDGTPPPGPFPMDADGAVLTAASSVFFSGILRSPATGPASREEILYAYYRLVEGFSQRSLTFDSDKLPAFSGLSQPLQAQVGGDYLAGLWSCDLLNGLCWRAEMVTCAHVREYRAPSWSWAVTNQRVVYEESSRPRVSQLEVLEYDVLPRDRSNPFGEVESARLLVEGLTMPVARSCQVMDATETGEGHCFYDEMDAGHEDVKDEANIIAHPIIATNVGVDGAEQDIILTVLNSRSSISRPFEIDQDKISRLAYTALLVSAFGEDENHTSLLMCLVLRERENEGGHRTCERVGQLKIWDWSAEWLERWVPERLTLR